MTLLLLCSSVFTGSAGTLASFFWLSCLAFTSAFSAHYLPFFFATAALSTRFGYGLPAALARAFAALFCPELSFLDLDFGLGLSQKAFFFTSSCPFSSWTSLLQIEQ